MRNRMMMAVCSLGLVTAYGQAPKAHTTATPHMTVDQQKQLVDQYCSDCHNPDEKRGSMTLTDLDLQHPEKNIDLAEKVIRRVGVNMMPPPGKARPDAATMKLFATSLASNVDTYAATRPAIGNPALHRLNRSEYSNSVHELLDVDVDAEKLLPSDAMSHGFDNMSDVLTLSPALMEAYIRAAGQISRQSIGDRSAAPLSSTYSLPRVVSQVGHVDGAPSGTRGGISVVHTFPADGLYTFKVTFYFSLEGQLFGAMQGNGQQIEISVNGARAAVFTLNPTMTKFDELRTPAIAVKAGPQRITAAFVNNYDGPVEDAVQPVGFSLLDLNQADLPGLTTLPHVHEFTVTGPTKVEGISETPSRKLIFSCHPDTAVQEEPCARSIVTRLAAQAYRRPVTTVEVARLMKLYELGHENGGFEGGVGVSLQAILSSPSFIYRFERSRQQGVRKNVKETVAPSGSLYPVSDLELASRLSYFLWSAAPDKTLFDFAEANKLHNPITLRAQVKRMLADPRSKSLSANFAGQWLHLQNLKGVQPDGYLYPAYDKTLGDSMRKETELFFGSVVHDDASVLTLLDGHYTYVNEQLAGLYGIPNVSGNRFRRVELTDQNRFGLLGQASILTLTSASNRTSPVIRGKYVMEIFFGTPPPPPPPNIPALKEHGDGGSVATVRERLEEHRKNPTCAACHKFMDPIGFALENYDPIGAWRSFDSGAPIDSAGVLYDGTKLSSPASLRNALMAHSDAFLGTFTENLFAYGMGRVLTPSDMPVVRSIAASAARHDNTFSSFVMGIVNSEPFRMRTAEPALPARFTAAIDLNEAATATDTAHH
ncbi:hypothetical protein HDF16_001545 [Granulicella aggregans]|uniref:DUF1592 domain-containing protein n=1 Tax=Granulicella aggregans TaxID=474949 RepID=A0A7W7ZBI1_9BACT|nr:DUF1592 domain-containing protein [Granulicella aggregans]MBB5056860.1 hypothetical protein [Granulicella aggregans]